MIPVRPLINLPTACSIKCSVAGSKRDDSMYSWTWEILQDQIASTLRNARPREVAERYKRA